MSKREKLDVLILQWMQYELEDEEEAAIEAELKRHAGSRTQWADELDVTGSLKTHERVTAGLAALAA